MKKIIFMAAFLLGSLPFKQTYAQIHLSVNLGVNINSQPDWGPVGYAHADYYYMPDIGVYYDVPAHQYIYSGGNGWVRAAILPPMYSRYDIYHGYKVVLNEPRPWMHDRDIRARYAGYRGRRDQAIIRDSHDDRYRNHWHDNGRHEGWDKHDNGRHNGRDNGNGNGDGNGDHGHDHGH